SRLITAWAEPEVVARATPRGGAIRCVSVNGRGVGAREVCLDQDGSQEGPFTGEDLLPIERPRRQPMIKKRYAAARSCARHVPRRNVRGSWRSSNNAIET